MLAKALSTPEKEVKPGILTHVITDAHIYENQMDGVKRQILNFDLMNAVQYCDRDDMVDVYADKIKREFPDETSTIEELVTKAKEAVNCDPKFVINAENPYDFFSYTADECSIEDYKHMDKIDFGAVAV
jgi:thymidylate synthase